MMTVTTVRTPTSPPPTDADVTAIEPYLTPSRGEARA
jgi:hypothetical protein